MATTHVLTMHLPHTVNFTKAKEERRFTLPIRSKTLSDLAAHPSSTSLLSESTPPHSPGINEPQGFFPQFGAGSQQKTYLTVPGNPRPLMRTDTETNLSGWGNQAIFNQPKSTARPLPSGSILDFQKAIEDAKRARAEAEKASRPRSGSSGNNYKNWTIEPAVQGNGGLVNAVREVNVDNEHDITWVGTVGFPTDSIPDSIKQNIEDTLHNEFQCSAVFVTDKDLDGHYNHFCKIILWPIFHYQVPDHPKSKAYADHSWTFYFNLNQAFAEKVVSTYKRGDTIWVHDYHLLLVPGMIRKKIPEAKIGFFLHTAFPSSEIFRCLAKRRDLLEGILGANLVAFQTDEYAQHFLQTCSRMLTVETTVEGVQTEDHFVNVTYCPIGINLPATNEARDMKEVSDWINILQQKYKGKHVIVARDKLDNIRGVRQKLLAYEAFLQSYPDWREKVVMIQVATSTSEQSELLATASDISTRIDQRYSDLSHQPLVFLKQDIPFSQYLAMLSIADTMMITPVRDGMNLTAHEFVACQDGNGPGKKHAPLILSEFTGSAAVLHHHPLIINPWNNRGMADAIYEAFTMTDAEKENRWKNLFEIVRQQTGGKWATILSEKLEEAYEERGTRDAASVPRLSVQQVIEKYKSANKRVFILDYEGTLVPHQADTSNPLSSPQRVVNAINELLADPRNVIYVMSGRKPEALMSDFRTVPQLGLIAENGCFLRRFGDENKKWVNFPEKEAVLEWKSAVKGILRYYEDRLEGSYIEERHCSVIFRFEKVPEKDAVTRVLGDCSDHINGACKGMGVRAVPIPDAIIIEHIDFRKNKAADYAWKLHSYRMQGVDEDGDLEEFTAWPDFVMVAGDDREDEAVFRWANHLSDLSDSEDYMVRNVFTVSVGRRNTDANSSLTQGTTGLLAVLARLARASADMASAETASAEMASTD